jgi:hypothetical protein
MVAEKWQMYSSLWYNCEEANKNIHVGAGARAEIFVSMAPAPAPGENWITAPGGNLITAPPDPAPQHWFWPLAVLATNASYTSYQRWQPVDSAAE